MIRRWKEYTEELYKKDAKTYTEVQEKAYTQEPSVMKSEVRKALWEIAGNKATGVDELPIELIKSAGETAITALKALCQQIWESNVWPKSGDPYSYLCRKKVTLDCVPITEPLH
jgi:hypothetical protein